eukprot:TRINITY_DN19144_c0_g1_i1.p2 TRINITY_DN19144_c0_g1~~TRINITY_DN19144_c0_g1_i1.p2  ORF type:complete len:135 (-),score=10.55 TRINITY_DN19144_c0_g1_i1:292-696(-)
MVSICGPPLRSAAVKLPAARHLHVPEHMASKCLVSGASPKLAINSMASGDEGSESWNSAEQLQFAVLSSISSKSPIAHEEKTPSLPMPSGSLAEEGLPLLSTLLNALPPRLCRVPAPKINVSGSAAKAPPHTLR